MIWFWSREKQKMQLETRYDNATKEYVITIRRPDDQQQTERFADLVAFRRRLVTLEKQRPTFILGDLGARQKSWRMRC